MKEILLIEDNSLDVKLLVQFLSEYKFTLLGDGEMVLEYVQKENPLPDLIILDLFLPKLDGHKALLEIRSTKSYQSIPILVLSGSRDILDEEKAIINGATKYMHKPIDLPHLKALVTVIKELIEASFTIIKD